MIRVHKKMTHSTDEKSLSIARVEILPFHKMGEEKYRLGGIPYRLTDTPSPTSRQIQTARDLFARYDIEAI